jgi:ABC-2 type transport system ATP-binding protein
MSTPLTPQGSPLTAHSSQLTPHTSPITPQSPAIHTLDLAKRYSRTTALAGLTMTVPRGEIFGFLGPNGAGKTTAVKLLVGLTRPTSGEAWLLGAPLGDRETRRRIGYLPELFRYQDWLSGREVLQLHGQLAGIPPRDQRRNIEEALDLVGLTGRASERVGTFSKGMQQRLGLAVALLGRPELVLLDEPTSALDPVGRHDVREIVRHLKHRGVTVFLNSHLLTEVEQICDRVAVIDRGRVIAMGTMDELRGASRRVRIRVTNLPPEGEALLHRYGRVVPDGAWYSILGIDPEDIPGLVSGLTTLGARIYAIEPARESLEDRFLELLGGTAHADPDDRASHPA